MKILHIITSLQLGGAETLVANLLKLFHDEGHEVGVVVFNGKQTELMERLERECPSCKVYRLGNSYYNPWYIFKLVRIMKNYDIVHTHNSSPQLYAAIANIFCKKKLVTTEHSTNNRKREQGGILRLIDKWMYRQYDKIICISKIAEEKLCSYLENNTYNNICTINNGVDVKAFQQAKPIDGLNSDKFTIVMVAGFREAKDQDTVIRAMSLLPKNEYELWLVGDGVRREILEKLVKGLHIEDSVKFLGFRSDVPNILKSVDVVVMSSHWEGLSLSNIEGMSVGKPVIASDVDGLHEITKDAGLLFPKGEAHTLADIIQQLFHDPVFYKQIADQCYARAQQYDIRKTVNQYLQVYNEFQPQ